MDEPILYDKDIREPLFDFLEETYGKIRIIEEKRMGSSRADLVMVLPLAVAGIEIKSDADTYARLARQVRDYDRFFDQNYVVVGTRHAMHIEEHIPDWWGIITVESAGGKADFYLLRQAKENPGTDWKKKLGLLWRPELAQIQELNRMPAYREKSKDFVIGKIAEQVPREVLRLQISEALFERDYQMIEKEIHEYRAEKKRTPRRPRRRR